MKTQLLKFAWLVMTFLVILPAATFLREYVGLSIALSLVLAIVGGAAILAALIHLVTALISRHRTLGGGVGTGRFIWWYYGMAVFVVLALWATIEVFLALGARPLSFAAVIGLWTATTVVSGAIFAPAAPPKPLLAGAGYVVVIAGVPLALLDLGHPLGAVGLALLALAAIVGSIVYLRLTNATFDDALHAANLWFVGIVAFPVAITWLASQPVAELLGVIIVVAAILVLIVTGVATVVITFMVTAKLGVEKSAQPSQGPAAGDRSAAGPTGGSADDR